MLKHKKLICLMSVCLIIIIIISVILLKLIKQKEIKSNIFITDNPEMYVNIKEKTNNDKIDNNNVIDKYDMIIINDCLQNYYNAINLKSSSYYINNNGEESSLFTKEEIGKIVLNMLDSKYIEENNINEENVFSYTGKLTDDVVITLINVEKIKNDNLSTYKVYYLIQGSNNKLVKKYCAININKEKRVFSIKNIEINNKSKEEIEKDCIGADIEKNSNNYYIDPIVNKEFYVKYYLEMFKNIILVYPEYGYELLNNKYKELRFGNYDNFKNYITNNKDYIKNLRLEKYSTNTENNKNEYIILDNYNNYIIIEENEPLNIEVLFDAYTIEVTDVINKYNKSNEIEKSGSNIEKFIQMINRKDYNAAYNVLVNNFKNKNYNTLEKFEEYIEKNLYSVNELVILNYEINGEDYIFKCKINDKESNEFKNINFIIKLKSGIDFELSFSIE